MTTDLINDIEQTPRQKLLREVELLLGGNLVTLGLDPEHYNVAFDVALSRYRQRSGNALEESFLFYDFQPDVYQYRLPDEVQEVRTIYRRTIGGTAGGAAVDPFSLAFTNNLYMVQNPGNLGTSGAGFLATYDFAMQYQMLIGRMFGMFIQFTFDSATKLLTLHRRISATEQACLHIYNTRPESVLLSDPYARPWLRDYTIAWCKQILGEARSKFSTIAGPQGGFTLNGEAMKQEAKAEMERLDTELEKLVDQHIGWPFTIG
jgi:hypothetical protein